MNQGNPVELPQGFVEFYKTVESWQNETFFRLKRTLLSTDEVEENILRQLTRPLMETQQFVLEPQEYKGAFMELAQLVKKERPGTVEKMDRIMEFFSEIDFSEVVDHILNQDIDFIQEMVAEKDLSRDLTVFVLDHSLRPFLRLFAFPYQDTIARTDISWDNGVCPVCGFRANISWVRGEDGIRFLFCEHCFTEWQTKYLGCTYCGNSEPGSIRYLVIEGDEARQIFVCDKCKGYLKTLDERKGLVDEGLFIAGIETVYLDLIAEEEGYTKNAESSTNLN